MRAAAKARLSLFLRAHPPSRYHKSNLMRRIGNQTPRKRRVVQLGMNTSYLDCMTSSQQMCFMIEPTDTFAATPCPISTDCLRKRSSNPPK